MHDVGWVAARWEEGLVNEDHKQTIKRFFTEVMAGEVDVVDEILAEDYREHEEFPGLTQDREGVKQFVGMFRSAFPDLRIEINDMVVENDTACVRSTWSGTHEGEFAGIPPTHKRFEVETYDLVKFRSDGRAAEHWGLTDSLKMMQQLGVIPEEM
jgi:steroid delta-isomerase-like uncharacterized protein